MSQVTALDGPGRQADDELGRALLPADASCDQPREVPRLLAWQILTHEFPCQATSSTSVALAVPPPSHMVCSPKRIPLSRM